MFIVGTVQWHKNTKSISFKKGLIIEQKGIESTLLDAGSTKDLIAWKEPLPYINADFLYTR